MKTIGDITCFPPKLCNRPFAANLHGKSQQKSQEMNLLKVIWFTGSDTENSTDAAARSVLKLSDENYGGHHMLPIKTRQPFWFEKFARKIAIALEYKMRLTDTQSALKLR